MLKSVMFLCVLALSKKKCRKVMCLYVFLEKFKSVMFLGVFDFYVFLLGRKGECRKVSCLSKSVMFFCVFWVKSGAGIPELSAQPIV